MNKLDEMLTGANLAVSVLANVNFSDLEILPFFPSAPTEPQLAELIQLWAPRKLRYIGAIALKNGFPQVAFVELLDSVRVAAVLTAFNVWGESMVRSYLQQQGDSTDWLKQIHALPDLRN